MPADDIEQLLKRTPASGARVLGRAAFESLLARRCNASSAGGRAGFALLLVRLRCAGDSQQMFRGQGPSEAVREAIVRAAAQLSMADCITDCRSNEIAVLLDNASQPALVMLAARRLFEAIAADERIMQAQIGAALAGGDTVLMESMLRAVDRACDEAAFAPERVAFADQRIVGSAHETLVPALRRAIASNALTVAYQPQYDLRSGQWTAMEALIRWPDAPAGQSVDAATLVDLAERHGLIEGLTDFVLNTALRHARHCQMAGLRLRVAVNLSPSSLTDALLPDRVAQALSTWAVAADQVVFEVTENSIVQDAAATTHVMSRIAQLGAAWSIDDFGTGHSSLLRLRDMPVTELKIDGTFVASMLSRPDDLKIVRAVIELAHGLDLQAVAEGVEDAATLAELERMGCDVVQGYFCARPMPASALVGWWSKRPSVLAALQA
jgi:EAL domain-containing protein (putative c-di-GMP-specific phosphodiesterase class I)